MELGSLGSAFLRDFIRATGEPRSGQGRAKRIKQEGLRSMASQSILSACLGLLATSMEKVVLHSSYLEAKEKYSHVPTNLRYLIWEFHLIK